MFRFVLAIIYIEYRKLNMWCTLNTTFITRYETNLFQGVITKCIKPEAGVFELDNKIR